MLRMSADTRKVFGTQEGSFPLQECVFVQQIVGRIFKLRYLLADKTG